jgi:hypothetical protein
MNLKKFYNMGKWEMDDPKGLGQCKRKRQWMNQWK